MSYEELRGLPPPQLQMRIKKLEESLKAVNLAAEAKGSINNALAAAKSVLEIKQLKGMMLQANAGSKDALRGIYFQMSKAGLMVRQ